MDIFYIFQFLSIKKQKRRKKIFHNLLKLILNIVIDSFLFISIILSHAYEIFQRMRTGQWLVNVLIIRYDMVY